MNKNFFNNFTYNKLALVLLSNIYYLCSNFIKGIVVQLKEFYYSCSRKKKLTESTKQFHYNYNEISEDIKNSNIRMRGLKSTIKHYGGLSSDSTILVAKRKHYSKIEKELRETLDKETIENNTLYVLRSKMVQS